MNSKEINKIEYVCPICKFRLGSVGKIEIIEGHDNYKSGWSGKGDLVVIPVQSGCGSKWELCIGQHKGHLVKFHRVVEVCVPYFDSFVYFIEAVRTDKVKIGVAKNPKDRLKALSTGSPIPLKLLGVMPGDLKLEKEIHLRFKQCRSDGEWFFLSIDLKRFIFDSILKDK